MEIEFLLLLLGFRVTSFNFLRNTDFKASDWTISNVRLPYFYSKTGRTTAAKNVFQLSPRSLKCLVPLRSAAKQHRVRIFF